MLPLLFFRSCVGLTLFGRGCKVYHAACGGVTHFALAPDDDGTVMTIAYGQGASNGERRPFLSRW